MPVDDRSICLLEASMPAKSSSYHKHSSESQLECICRDAASAPACKQVWLTNNSSRLCLPLVSVTAWKCSPMAATVLDGTYSTATSRVPPPRSKTWAGLQAQECKLHLHDDIRTQTAVRKPRQATSAAQQPCQETQCSTSGPIASL